MDRRLRVLVVGCGNMGASHARAYHRMPEFEIVGLVSRGPGSRGAPAAELGGTAQFGEYGDALLATRPDVVSINTYPETHGPYVGSRPSCSAPSGRTSTSATTSRTR